jgi:LuxR family maltose regulon positive regulatory protein
MARAKELVLKHATPVLFRGEVATVLRWSAALPEEMKADDPFLALGLCWALFLSGQIPAITSYLEGAEEAYEKLVSERILIGAEKNFLASQLSMMRSILARARGDHVRSVAHAEEAARLVPPEMEETIGTPWNMLAAARAGAGDFDGDIDAYERGIALTRAEGNLIGAYGCIYGQTMFIMLKGRLNDAEQLCRQSIYRAESEGHGDFPAAGWLHIAMARINLERYRLDETEVYLRDGLRISLPGGFGEAWRAGRYLRAHLAAANGDLDTAADIIQDTGGVVNAIDDPYLTGEINWEWARLCLKAGDLDSAREKLQILEEKSAATQHAILLLWRRWLSPRLLYAEESYEEALSILDEAIHDVRAVNSNGELIRLLVLQAVALDALGDRLQARAALQEALALGATEGFIWRWLDAGPGIGPLLDDLKADRDTPQGSRPYLDSLLDACQAAIGEPTQPQRGELISPLTTRELEILRLICKGYSNPEIANELVVTINTIKKHTSNIYGKLGVRSRTHAIARAHELNLL